MTVIRCVIWDCFNVLINYDTPSFFAFLEKYSANHLPPENLFSGRGLELVMGYDLGKFSSSDFFLGIRDLFELSSEVDSELFFSVIGSIMKPDRETLAIMHDLRKKGIATTLISNMNSFNIEHIMNNYPEFLGGYDYKFISCEEGISKPNPEAWIRTLDYLGLKAEECLFIDDSLSNILVASSLGINVVYYNVTDHVYCHNGKLDQERNKLREYLHLLWVKGILKPR